MMPEGWVNLDKERHYGLVPYPKNLQTALDLMKEMAEALEAYRIRDEEQLSGTITLPNGSTLTFSENSKLAENVLKKWREWR